jgi:hypothetical protein
MRKEKRAFPWRINPMLTNLLLSSLLMSNASAEDLSSAETSYSGATILEGDVDITFDTYEPVDPSWNNSYAWFEGSTLYMGNEDDCGNSVDAIIEFFWFQSSIDRGSDFYVAIIKARSTPGMDCSLWADEWQDWGEYPVLSVEAMTDISREAGAFRWDWAVPFENYGIDAYGQISFTNSYGIGGNVEGAALAHGEYQLDEDGNVKAAGDVQVKGYVSSDYRVQTQYEVTLYEWDMWVDGSADSMAWDMYLNLGARDDQSAYHEYFMSIQVEEGETFLLDEINIAGNFDTSWWNPWGDSEVGVSLQGIEISPPFWEAEEEEEDDSWDDWEDEDEDDWDDWDDEDEDEDIDPEDEDPSVDPEEEDVDYGDPGFEDEDEDDMPSLENNGTEPSKSGCSVAGAGTMGGLGLSMLLAVARRRED